MTASLETAGDRAPHDPMDDAVAEDLKLLTRMAAQMSGMSNAFITFADPARAPIHAHEESYCTAALREDDMLVAEDVREDERTRAIALRRQESDIVTYAAALIKTDDGRKLGTLCITDAIRRPLQPEQMQLLRGLARQAMNLLSLRQTQKDLTAALEKMTRLATLDDLTGLLNRRAFFDEAERQRSLVRRRKGSMCVAIIDIDHFKKVNDEHGHAAGDAVLKAVARTLREGLRDSDLVGRIGGEEFALAMPFTRLQDAIRRLQQLRQGVALQKAVGGIRVTLSGGIGELEDGQESIAVALKRADEALYRAKTSGRNQILPALPPVGSCAQASITAASAHALAA